MQTVALLLQHQSTTKLRRRPTTQRIPLPRPRRNHPLAITAQATSGTVVDHHRQVGAKEVPCQDIIILVIDALHHTLIAARTHMAIHTIHTEHRVQWPALRRMLIVRSTSLGRYCKCLVLVTGRGNAILFDMFLIICTAASSRTFASPRTRPIIHKAYRKNGLRSPMSNNSCSEYLALTPSSPPSSIMSASLRLFSLPYCEELDIGSTNGRMKSTYCKAQHEGHENATTQEAKACPKPGMVDWCLTSKVYVRPDDGSHVSHRDQ